MKKTVSMLLSSLLMAQCLPLASAAEAASVKGVRVSSESVYITTDRPVKYRSFTVGEPERIVVELSDARLRTLEDIPVGGTFLKKVRTGQHRTAPVSVARVVMDLTQKAVYDITQKGNEIIVVVGGKLFEARARVKDAPAAAAAPSTAVKVITPSPEPAPAAPAPQVSASDLKSESVPLIKPAPAVKRPASSRNIMESLSREPVSFDYNDADIRDVIAMLAAKAGVNVIYGDDVSGTVTMNLSKVPFDEAFKTVLNVKGLATQQVGDNILRIASPQTFVAEQKKAMPQTRLFFLNYSKAEEVKTQLLSVASAEGRTSSAVNVDVANNALIITDTPMGLEAAARLIKDLDRMPKQVLIEAKLVEVALDNSFHLGINWSAYGQDKGGSYIGSQSDPVSTPPVERLGGTMLVNKAMTAESGGTGVNLPANVIYGAFRLGKVASNYMFDAVISAASKKGKAKVLSDPKVATLNNKEANIDITTQVPYTTTEITAATPPISTTKVTYLSVGIKLTVTPTINSDGRISMKINPSVSQISPTITAVAGGAPGIDMRSADTNVIVRDGETIVIGGLISDTQAESVFKVPLLGDIPLLGYLFRKKSVTRDRRELLIFVTPRILEG
ncbi:MAG TPA: type IV pilus secretin PilQ [Elusimicrobiales bacterium]|nr:type IV pilus secretin PilQ [Elusimicrobiales bacterium]